MTAPNEPLTPAAERTVDNTRQSDVARVRQLRSQLPDNGNRNPRTNGQGRPIEYRCGQRSRGSTWLSIQVQAFCQCGWAAPWQHWTEPPGAAKPAALATDAALQAHQTTTGHRRYTGQDDPEPDDYHHACSWIHDFQDLCPAPPTSPAGRVNRICGASGASRQAGALDQLAAIRELHDWLEEQEAQGIIRARLAGCHWADIATAMATQTCEIQHRWAPIIQRYEVAGLLKTPSQEQTWRSP
jgi:hypothetical protein